MASERGIRQEKKIEKGGCVEQIIKIVSHITEDVTLYNYDTDNYGMTLKRVLDIKRNKQGIQIALNLVETSRIYVRIKNEKRITRTETMIIMKIKDNKVTQLKFAIADNDE